MSTKLSTVRASLGKEAGKRAEPGSTPKRGRAIFLLSGLIAFSVAISTPASAVTIRWSTYFNAYTNQGVQRWSQVAIVSGGSSQATIGETGSSYIRTYNALGTLVHETRGANSDKAQMTHTVRFDARSACIWKAKVPSTATAQPMVCRMRHQY